MTYGSLQRVDLAGVGLDLVAVLHGLLLGHSQGIVVLVDGLVQVSDLKRKQRWLLEAYQIYGSIYQHLPLYIYECLSMSDFNLCTSTEEKLVREI